MKKNNLFQHYYDQGFINQENLNVYQNHSLFNRDHLLQNSKEQTIKNKHRNCEDLTSSIKSYHRKGSDCDTNPQSRRFLRHTTYVPRSATNLDQQTKQFSFSNISATLKRNNSYKDSNIVSGNSSYSTDYETSSRNNHRYVKFNNYNLLQPKFKTQENFYSFEGEVKDKHQYQPQLFGQQKRLQNELNKTSQNFSNMGFKKKQFKPYFYTPKPDSTQPIDMKQFKRISSPQTELFKIFSPSAKQIKGQISIKDFIIDAKIGGGKYGSVHKAIHIKTGSIYAIKKISKKLLEDNMMIDQFTLQCKIQSFLKHQNILQVFGILSDSQNIYIVLQYMLNGSLFSQLRKKKTFSENQAALKIKQIANAIIYMHDNGVVHRDIKPQNIVLTGNVCKVCDFGWATICKDRRKTNCGTFDYVAPQIFEGHEYDFSVDYWCLGVLCYEILVGKPPFYHLSRKQTVSHIVNVEYKKINFPETISSVAKSFIEELLKKNPSERLSSVQILRHPFIMNAKQE